jgi:hypothetical protein
MKKKLGSLKMSVDAERKAVQAKSSDIENRIAKADVIFKENETMLKAPAVKEATQHIIKDAFSMKETEYRLIKQCMDRGLDYRHVMNKSEVMRAGLVLLAGLPNDEFIAAARRIEKIKLGRPKQKKMVK